ncbi:MAG TPA: YdeI/OmpD-associated family protein, partial [Candidatus Limnocylindrales bacterium]
WLEANGEQAQELWVGLPKTTRDRKPPFGWPELVDELLAVGWIDGVRMPLPPDAHALRVTPRRPGSNWSARNVARVEALRAEARMRAAGEAAFARRREDRTGVYSFENATELDAAAIGAIQARVGAWEWFEAQPAGYRRMATHWVMSAKRPETRAARLARLVQGCAEGFRLPEFIGRAATR